jgi:dephospho-CoA kinase
VFDADAVVHGFYHDTDVMEKMSKFLGVKIATREDAVEWTRHAPSLLPRMTEFFTPYIEGAFQEELDREPEILFVDHPLLFETMWNKKCDHTVAIVVNEDIRINRVLKRPGMTPDRYRDRRNLQYSNDRLIELADCAVWNNDTVDEFFKQFIHIMTKWGIDLGPQHI